MSSSIPAFYRIWFTTIDPLLCLLGIYSNVFTPEKTLSSYSPSFVPPPSTETIVLLDTRAAFLVGLIFLELVLLRARPRDVTIWRAVEGSILLVNCGMLGAFGRALHSQGRMDFRFWKQEEWMNCAVTVWLTALRAAFLAGVGTVQGETRKRT